VLEQINISVSVSGSVSLMTENGFCSQKSVQNKIRK
jgi:hypothetical protein